MGTPAEITIVRQESDSDVNWKIIEKGKEKEGNEKESKEKQQELANELIKKKKLKKEGETWESPMSKKRRAQDHQRAVGVLQGEAAHSPILKKYQQRNKDE